MILWNTFQLRINIGLGFVAIPLPILHDLFCHVELSGREIKCCQCDEDSQCCRRDRWHATIDDFLVGPCGTRERGGKREKGGIRGRRPGGRSHMGRRRRPRKSSMHATRPANGEESASCRDGCESAISNVQITRSCFENRVRDLQPTTLECMLAKTSCEADWSRNREAFGSKLIEKPLLTSICGSIPVSDSLRVSDWGTEFSQTKRRRAWEF